MPAEPTMTTSWLDHFHPAQYEIEGERYNRCPTCEEWSPCRVRMLADACAGLELRGAANVGSRQSITGLDGTSMLVDHNTWTDYVRALVLIRGEESDGLAAYTADGGNALPEDDPGD